MSLTLLAPTDFSRSARNAVSYAAEMARRMKGKLILFHAYLPPVPVSEIPMVIPLPAESETYIFKKLKRIKNDLLSKRGNKNLEIEIVCTCGVPVDEIYLYTLRNKVDFVIVGMQGKGFLREKLIGSTTTSLIQKSEVPVLSIDGKVKFRTIKKIVFASDDKGNVSQSTLQPLSKFCSVFKSHIYVLNIVLGRDLSEDSGANFKKKISSSFKKLDHSIHRIINSTIVQGLKDFITLKRMDMLVMIPHQHNLTELILNGRQTKQMAFHSTVPLLSLHEKKHKIPTP